MSLYKRLHEVQATTGATSSRRDPILDELRQKIHHHLIDSLGPVLYDRRLSEDDLRRRVHEQLQAALAQERAPLSAADKAQLIQDVSDDILGYGPIDRLLKDEDITEVMLGEIRAGASRAESLRALERRCDVPEMRSFVLAILQADTFGVSIGRVLRTQADEMRVKRRQIAQEKAMKAPVKMLVPMVLCIFPSLFIVVLAPAVINILKSF